jgi:predicted phage-related endonuclease
VEIMLTDAAFGAIAVLTVESAAECHIVNVARNRDAEASIAARVARFWQDFREGRDPDPNPAKDAAVVRALYPRSREGEICDLTGNNRFADLLARRADLCAEIKSKEAEVEAIETELKFTMGEAEQAIGLPGWRITYRTIDRKGYTVEPGKIRPLRVYDRRNPPIREAAQ